MAATRSKGKTMQHKDKARIPWALMGAVAFGGLAVLILYVMILAPGEGLLS